MQCNDDIRDIMEPNPTQQQVKFLQTKFSLYI